MDSLMAALVAALLIRATDNSAGLTAIIAGRSHRPLATFGGVAVALTVTQTLAVIGGMLVAPHMTVNASRLLFGVSLLMAGGGAVWPKKTVPPANVDRPAVTVAGRLIATGVGDRTMFATFAVAAGAAPVLAGVGGFIGGAAVLAGAALAGERRWRARPRRALAWAIGGVLMIAGAWLALSALRLS